jgi:hypothetical protein
MIILLLLYYKSRSVDGLPLGKSVGLKMYGVSGKKLQPGMEDLDEMDMLFNNAPGFFCPDMVCLLLRAGYYVDEKPSASDPHGEHC